MLFFGTVKANKYTSDRQAKCYYIKSPHLPFMRPSPSYPLILKGLSASRIQKFLPNSWKRCIEPDDVSMANYLKFLANKGCLSDAFKSFSLLKIHVSSSSIPVSYDPILESFSSLLSSCTNFKSVYPGKQLHAQIIFLGLQQDLVLVRQLVTFYSRLHMLSDAFVLTESSSVQDTITWNLLISSCVKNSLFREALSAYKQMVNRGIKPDNYTYPSILKACREEGDLDLGREIHCSIDNGSHGGCLFVNNALVSMYAKVGEVVVAHQLFEKMPERDSISWNIIISAFASKGMWEKANQLFDEMIEARIEGNIMIWNTIAGGYLRTSNFGGALKLLSRMRFCGICLDSVAMIIGLGACSHIGAIRLGKEIHAALLRSYIDGLDNVRNALITMYARCKNLRHAYTLFSQREATSISTWNSMLSGYAHMDRFDEAYFLFRKMLFSGIKPNYVTVASILPLCAREANLQYGKEFHCYIIRRDEFMDYLLLWNSLVEMYARSGKLSEAKKVFNSMSVRDQVSYTSLISGYGIQGKGHAALALFEEMIEFGIKPDHITMVSVLSACSHSGLVSQGKSYFDKMVSLYGINPRLEHYSCMTDLFGRAGLLNNAKGVMLKMPCKPSAAMWATLLGACRIHGNTEIGEWAAEKLLEMKPENPGYYVLIANMYAAAGCWSKLAEVRTFMRDFGVRKAPGCAWVDTGAGFTPFVVEDTANPRVREINSVLEGLSELIKDAGYISTEDFDIFLEENRIASLSSGMRHLAADSDGKENRIAVGIY